MRWVLTLVILGASFLAARDPARRGQPPRPELARDYMATLQTAIDTYRLFEQRLPPTLHDLTAVQPGQDEPYLSHLRRDPWGGAYLYATNETGYRMSSAGPDGTWGTADDLHWPQEDLD